MPIFALSAASDGSERDGVRVSVSIVNGINIIQQSLTVELRVEVFDDPGYATAGKYVRKCSFNIS